MNGIDDKSGDDEFDGDWEEPYDDRVEPIVVETCPGCGDVRLHGLDGDFVECKNCGEVVRMIER